MFRENGDLFARSIWSSTGEVLGCCGSAPGHEAVLFGDQ